jgi:hypothetical protein
MIRHIKKGKWGGCNVKNCGELLGCIHEYIPYACHICGNQMVMVTKNGHVFCEGGHYEPCYEADSLEVAKAKLIPMIDGEFIPDPPSYLPYMMRSVAKDGKPEKKDKRQVLAYTPNIYDEFSWSITSAKLFEKACGNATHWIYLDKPVN